MDACADDHRSKKDAFSKTRAVLKVDEPVNLKGCLFLLFRTIPVVKITKTHPFQ